MIKTWNKRDDQLETPAEIQERIQSIVRQREKLINKEGSRYPSVAAQNEKKLRKLNQRWSNLTLRLTELRKKG